jgi:hypothetical protein
MLPWTRHRIVLHAPNWDNSWLICEGIIVFWMDSCGIYRRIGNSSCKNFELTHKSRRGSMTSYKGSCCSKNSRTVCWKVNSNSCRTRLHHRIKMQFHRINNYRTRLNTRNCGCSCCSCGESTVCCSGRSSGCRRRMNSSSNVLLSSWQRVRSRLMNWGGSCWINGQSTP